MTPAINKNLISIAGVIGIILVFIGVYLWQRGDALPVQPRQDTESIIRNNATQALKAVADVANEISGITSGAVFTFEVVDTDGHFANFGIMKYADDIRADALVEEHAVTFHEIGEGSSGNAEVDRDSHQVISMHRRSVDFGGKLPKEILEQRVRQFLEKVEPNFYRFEPILTYDVNTKSAPERASNYFFRWNDLSYRKTLPTGVETDIDPFIQVGITDGGFIFGYDNTVSLYRSCKVWQSQECIPVQ